MKHLLSFTAMALICLAFTIGYPSRNLNALESYPVMKISIKVNDKTTIFELNNSPASKEFYAQLPLSIAVKNYGNNEKIFYPPKKLVTTTTPLADAKPGTLAYYAPWGNVVMFYGSFGSAEGLYELGHAISGNDFIREMSGMVRIEKTVQSSPNKTGGGK